MRFAFLTFCLGLMSAGSAFAQDSQLPVTGFYVVTMTHVTGRVERGPPIYKTTADFLKMIRGESTCKNKRNNIGRNSFDETSTCDTPDQDIRNIPTHRYGTFSRRSFEETQDLQLFGRTVSEKKEYVLVRAAPPLR